MGRGEHGTCAHLLNPGQQRLARQHAGWDRPRHGVFERHLRGLYELVGVRPTDVVPVEPADR